MWPHFDGKLSQSKHFFVLFYDVGKVKSGSKTLPGMVNGITLNLYRATGRSNRRNIRQRQKHKKKHNTSYYRSMGIILVIRK